MTVFFIESALTAGAWPFMDLYIPVVGIPVALYSVALNRSPRLALASLLVSFGPAALGAASTLRTPHLPESQRAPVFVSTLVVLVMAAIGAVVLGNVRRGIRRHVQQLQRAREATREVGVLSSERRRVAGVLVGVHQLTTVIVVQATRATHLADTDAVQVAQALKHIGSTAQQALSELRRLFEAVEVTQPTRDTVGSGNPARNPGPADRRT
jgi:signal transduction histidine kinase